MKIDILKKVLMSESEYWVFHKYETYWNSTPATSSVFFAVIPLSIHHGKKYEEITLKDLEQLERVNLDGNVFLYPDYPPFQQGQTFYSVVNAFPVEKNVKEFFTRALALKSKEYYDYEDLYKQILKEMEPEVIEESK
jgi:hypothetical protein